MMRASVPQANSGEQMAKVARRKPKRAAAKKKPRAGAEELLGYYRKMLLIRRFEEKSGQLYGMGLIGGFCHLYIGQEAVVVGMQSEARPEDTLVTSYRDHAHMLMAGMDPRGVMAELTGRRDGYSAGKGGSMHMFSREKNFFGGHGIVGADVPIGTGLAFAHKYRKDGAASMTYFGDGAVNQGQVYESFNMAALWRLPAVYVIENNHYAMGTSLARASAQTQLYKRGLSMGIPGRQVDGMDVLAVAAAAAEVLPGVRGGKGPVILEMMTYRYRGHSMSDPAQYRSREEVRGVRAGRDPIDHVRRRLVEGKMAKKEALKEIDTEIKELVSQAADFAEQSPEPDAAELYTDIYA